MWLGLGGMKRHDLRSSPPPYLSAVGSLTTWGLTWVICKFAWYEDERRYSHGLIKQGTVYRCVDMNMDDHYYAVILRVFRGS